MFKNTEFLTVIYKGTLAMEKSSLFLAIAKSDNENYTIFENEYSKLSNFGIWFTNSSEKILRTDNPNLKFMNLEDSMRILQNRIISRNGENEKVFYKKALNVLEKENFSYEKNSNYKF